MFRRALILGLMVVGLLALVLDANACHRCRGRGYGVSGCGSYCHGNVYGYGGYRVVKVYRTVKVPVQTCSTTCTPTCDACGNTIYTSTPTCTTTYVTQRVLVHSQVVGRGPVYGNYNDGSYRQVAGGYGYDGYGHGGYGHGGVHGRAYGGYASPYRAPGYGLGGGYGYGTSRAPYSSGYGLGGGYRMGGYGADKSASDFVTVYKAVDAEKEPEAKVVGMAF